MKSEDPISEEAGAIDTDELFEMANLYPRTTGLPMTVWVSPRGNARHDVRVKINMAHGNQTTVDNTAVVAVRPAPHVVAGRLSTADQEAVFAWIAMNAAAIIAYWDGNIDTAELIQTLKPLPTTQ
jgi:D-alanyl-D-alanine carboxypeptidase